MRRGCQKGTFGENSRQAEERKGRAMGVKRGREVKEVVKKKGEEVKGILKRVIIEEEEWRIIGVYVNGI